MLSIIISEGYSTLFVNCLSVCLYVPMFYATTRNEITKQRYQRVHRYTGFIFLKGNFHITTAFKSYAAKSK